MGVLKEGIYDVREVGNEDDDQIESDESRRESNIKHSAILRKTLEQLPRAPKHKPKHFKPHFPSQIQEKPPKYHTYNEMTPYDTTGSESANTYAINRERVLNSHGLLSMRIDRMDRDLQKMQKSIDVINNYYFTIQTVNTDQTNENGESFCSYLFCCNYW